MHVLPLICTILVVHSGYEVDRTLVSLILPNAERVFSANCGPAIETINLIFSVLNSNPSPQDLRPEQLLMVVPILTVGDRSKSRFRALDGRIVLVLPCRWLRQSEIGPTIGIRSQAPRSVVPALDGRKMSDLAFG
jgi:hypothetical protein